MSGRHIAELALFLYLGTLSLALGQTGEDEKAVEVEEIFAAPRHINLLTVEPLPKKSMHFTLMHTFGTLDGGVENLFGLDNGANILIGFEYGLGEKVSLGLSRTSLDKFLSCMDDTIFCSSARMGRCRCL